MTKKKATNEVRPEVAQYPIFTLGMDNFLSVVEDNLQGEILSANDLMQIRLPTGGGLQWSLPSIDGAETISEFEGIILHQQMTRSYWKSGIENGSSAPNCQSNDGKTGIGSPGGDCEGCPNSQYGSNLKSKTGRQACKLVKHVFLLLPNAYIPLTLVLPPSSLKPFRQFVLQLSSANVSLQEVVVRFGLEKSANRSNIAYSQATFSVKERLSTDEAATIAAYATAVKEQGMFDLSNVLTSDFNGNGNGNGEG